MNVLFVDTASAAGDRIDRLAAMLDGLNQTPCNPGLFCSRPDLFGQRLTSSVPTRTAPWEGFADVTSDKAGLARRSLSGLTLGKRSARFEKQVRPAFEVALDSFKPDLVHLNGLEPALNVFASICSQSNIPYVTHASEIRPFASAHLATLETASTVLACSEAVKTYLLERFPEVYYRRYEIAPWPCIPAAKPYHDAETTRRMLNTPNGAKIVVVSPPLADYAGQSDALQALDAIAQERCDVIVCLAGVSDSHFENELRNMAAQLGLESQVRFTGSDIDWGSLLGAADLFVYAAKNQHPDQGPVDGAPRTVTEAMAAGLPVVVTDSGGASDPILGTDAGAVVPPNSPEALSRAIGVYLTRPKLVQKARQAAHQRALQGLSAKQLAKRWLAVFEDAVQAASTRKKKGARRARP